MYRVLIAEDEMLMRLGLKNSIRWDEYNMEVVSDASNGQIAWEMYEKYKPDLVITDLKMPVMGGMEFIEKIRRQDGNTVIIILTCLEEFEQIRKAMKLGVLDYIPKLTVTEEETGAVLEKARKELDKLKKEEKARDGSSNPGNLNKEKLIKDFLFYGICSTEEFGLHAGTLKLNIDPGRMQLCLLEIDNYNAFKNRFEDERGQLIKTSMLNVLDELLANWKRGEAVYENESRYILLFSFKDIISEQVIRQTLEGILNNIRHVMETFFGTSVSFGISGVRSGYDALKGMYREADAAIGRKFLLGSSIYCYSDLPDLSAQANEKLEKLSGIPELIRYLDAEGIRKYREMIDGIRSALPGGKEKVKQVFCRILQFASDSMRIKEDDPGKSVIEGGARIRQCETMDDLIEAFKSSVSEMAETEEKGRAMSKEVAEAVKFINANFGRDINLQTVAASVCLSPAYLSSLFKKELGVNFIEYLNKLRVDKAKELLLKTYMKSYEIAEKAGFSEHTYFSKVFKKLTGTSPNEFRRQRMKEWSGEIENEED